MEDFNNNQLYTPDELELIHDLFVHHKHLSVLEKVIGRHGEAIVGKLHKLRRKDPEKWEAAYHFYLKGYNEIYGGQVREAVRKREAKRKMENQEMVKKLIVYGEDVKSFDIKIS